MSDPEYSGSKVQRFRRYLDFVNIKKVLQKELRSLTKEENRVSVLSNKVGRDY